MGVVAILLLSMSMTSCNSIKSLFNNTQPQDSEQQGDDKDKANQTEIATPDPAATSEPETKDVLPNNIRKMGEDVSERDVQNGKAIPDALVYTVEKATLFTDIAEVGISQDAMQPSVEEFLDENGEMKSSVKFLVVEMTVKNVSALPERNITSFQLLCADSTKETSDRTTEIDFFDLPYPSYFSNPSGSKVGDDWKQYYDYSLPVGQSKDLKVGWYVDLEQYDPSNLYLVFNRGHDEFENFVKLDY